MNEQQCSDARLRLAQISEPSGWVANLRRANPAAPFVRMPRKFKSTLPEILRYIPEAGLTDGSWSWATLARPHQVISLPRLCAEVGASESLQILLSRIDLEHANNDRVLGELAYDCLSKIEYSHDASGLFGAFIILMSQGANPTSHLGALRQKRISVQFDASSPEVSLLSLNLEAFAAIVCVDPTQLKGMSHLSASDNLELKLEAMRRWIRADGAVVANIIDVGVSWVPMHDSQEGITPGRQTIFHLCAELGLLDETQTLLKNVPGIIDLEKLVAIENGKGETVFDVLARRVGEKHSHAIEHLIRSKIAKRRMLGLMGDLVN